MSLVKRLRKKDFNPHILNFAGTAILRAQSVKEINNSAVVERTAKFRNR